MKKFFRKIAAFFVTIYAKRLYKQGVDKAERLHKRVHKKMYLIVSPADPKKLVALTGQEFKQMKRTLRFKTSIYNTIPYMQSGCWYYTCDQFGKYGMSDRDVKVRKLAFVRYILMLADLA